MTAPRRHEGSCRCGAVRFEVSGEPVATYTCHCRGCQKMTGGPYSLTAMFPRAQLRILAGETELGGVHGQHRQDFCPRCKSWMFTRPDGMDDVVNIRTVLLDGPAAFPPYADTHLAEALPGVSSGAEVSFAGQPGEDELPRIIAANAEFLARHRR